VSAATARTMTSTPNPHPVRWLLEVTAAAASVAPASFEQQRQFLRSVAQFDRPSRAWWAYMGALDVQALRSATRRPR